MRDRFKWWLFKIGFLPKAGTILYIPRRIFRKKNGIQGYSPTMIIFDEVQTFTMADALSSLGDQENYPPVSERLWTTTNFLSD